MKWPIAKFEEVALPAKGSIVSGPFGSNISSRFFVEEGIPVIRGNNLTFGERRFVDDGFVYLTEEKAHEFRNCEALAGDLVFTAAGTIGQVGIIPSDARFERYIISNKQLRVRCDRSKVSPLFLFLWFTMQEMRQHIINKNTGCSIPLINLGILRGLPVPVPPVEVQERIASNISAYDDLIENNRRRMALLERAARLLYEEWFVRLRFPGHEDTRISDGVPEGWNLCALDDLCRIGRGASPRPIMKFMGGEIPWFKIGDATASESCFISQTREHVTEAGAKNSVLLDPGALILSNSATCGIPYFTGVRGCVHDGWLHFSELTRISQQFLYCYLYFKREELVSSVSDGSTQKNLNTAAVGRLQLCLPCSDTLLTQFQQMAEPAFLMVRKIAQQNMALRTARDLLLPRLMSGELSV